MATETHGPLTLEDGWAVYSADGEDLGTVDGLKDGYFKVNVSMGYDYYLRYDLIERKQDQVVYLRVTKDELEHEKVATDVPPDSSARVKDQFGGEVPETPTEARYSAESDYLLHPRPQL
jgi:hypothetical protein